VAACIGKGKAGAAYGFGVNVSIVTTNARAPGGQFVLRAKAVLGRPYVGHTLRTAIEETQKLTGQVRWHGLARSNTSCRD
jgi:IS5 family transposase